MFCQKCGFQNQEQAKFCERCGERLAASAQAEERTEQTENQKDREGILWMQKGR
ncbi:MAG: zinc-ribbon domain-containing protein [Blautia sp.]